MKLNWLEVLEKAHSINNRRIERGDDQFRNIGEEMAVCFVALAGELERITELEELVNEMAYRLVKLEGKVVK